ncbi:hypothetical protein CVT26_007851 [Gymnopilus dilepis]|uniref:Uncharacterized protein n=1 Tax=Gymnopilus dilepis TaxID=231916 RepID=A0A409WER8_9AGAR|nr:hypothetical protein CVT26_007851 [Gymnopilus dilepis]
MYLILCRIPAVQVTSSSRFGSLMDVDCRFVSAGKPLVKHQFGIFTDPNEFGQMVGITDIYYYVTPAAVSGPPTSNNEAEIRSNTSLQPRF